MIPNSSTSIHTRESIETWLVEWLAGELGINVDAIDTRKKSFLDYGLDSQGALMLIHDLEVWLGQQLHLTLAWDHPYIKDLADHLAQKSHVLIPSPWSWLVEIQSGGSKPPFFGIHGAYGGVFMYYDLARYLAVEQPVYGLQAQGLDGKKAPQTRIQDMAADYISEIRTVQPEGPYFLGGYSMGGRIAFEMAQQMQAQGQKIAILALFDTQSPNWLKPLPVNTRAFRHLTNLLKLEPKEKLNYLYERLGSKFYSSNTQSLPPANMQPLPQVRYQSRLRKAHDQANSDYVLQVYPDQVILFRAIELLEEWLELLEWHQIELDLGWSSLVTGGLEIQEVPGDHMNMLNEPHVRVLAEKLQICIDKAQANQ